MKHKTTHTFMRAAVLLLVMMLTTATAWADDPSWLKPGDSWDATTKTLTVNTATVVDVAYRNNNVIENVIVGNGVTSIGAGAFQGCTNLKTVFVGNGVTSIGISAFAGCTNLKTVFVGNGVTGIGDGAFYGCTNLQTVIMTRISSAPIFSSPFPNNANLKIYVPMDNYGNILKVYINCSWYFNYKNNLVGSWMSGTCAAGLKDGVLTVVGFGALENCIGDNSRSNITSVIIEEGVTSIGDRAFDNCVNLASITVADGNQAFDSRDGCNAIIRTADNALVLGCKTTVIPASVTSIGDLAFYGCGGLTAISIPDGVTSIGDQAFSGCSGLTTISIPDGVTSIGDGAFRACSNLESVHIGSGVTSIAISAFNDCNKLATITVDTGNQTFDSRDGCNAIIRKTDNALVAGCKTTVIPNSVTSIGDQAFFGCSGLTTISIPDGVTSIGISAFYSCSNLASVTLNGVGTIGENAFYTGTTVTIAEGLILYNGTELLSGAITDMSKLNGKTLQRCYSITLPEHVTASGTAGVLNNIIYAFLDATVTISAATGYAISNIAVNGSPIEGNSFTMPGEGVTVTADVKKLMTNKDITITIPEQTYTGSAIEPEVTVTDGETTLTLGTDYTIGYSANVNVGTATATITGMGNYAGSKEETFTILPSTVMVSVTGSGTVTCGDRSATDGTSFGVMSEKGASVVLTLAPTDGNAVRSVEYGYTNSEETISGIKLPINGSAATLTVPDDMKDGTYVNLTVTFVSALAGGADEASAVALTDNTVTNFAGGWYKVNSDITFDHTLNLLGDTHLIIDDGKTMTVNTASGEAIDCEYTLNVSGEGALNITTTDDYGIAVFVGNYVQTGATVTVNGYIGIRCKDDFRGFDFDNDFTFSGGQLTATGSGGDGIDAENHITLSCSNATDFIQASSYRSTFGAVKIAEGKALTDGTEASNGMNGYSGTLTNEQRTAIGGKTLHRAVTTSYVDATGTLHENVMAIPIDESQTDYGTPGTGEPCWYVVDGEVSLDHLHFYDDFTHLILADGARLTANSSTEIAVRAKGFTIYGQSSGTGQIIASSEKLEGIGVDANYMFTINGGNISAATSRENKAGISIGDITINGGNVEAIGGENGNGIRASNFTINGGNVTATGTVENGYGICGRLTINGGNVTATATGENGQGIFATGNGITLAGGNVTATGGENGEGISGTTTLAGGTVWASSYSGAVKTPRFQDYYTDGTKIYSGTLSNDQKSYIAGKTMQPALRLRDNGNNNTAISGHDGETSAIFIADRTLYKDGDWNTLTLPFDLGDEEAQGGHEFDGTPLEGATVKALANSESSGTGYDASTGTLTLYFVDANKIEAGVPYLVKWDKAADYDDNPSDYDIVSPVFLDITVSNEDPAERKVTSSDGKVQFIGNYDPVVLTGGDASNLYLGAANQLYWPSADRTINAFRGYFHVNLSGAGQVRSIRLNLGDKVTGVTLIDNGQLTIDNYAGADSWYDLQGRKLSGKPTQKGVYIYKGKKVVIDF